MTESIQKSCLVLSPNIKKEGQYDLSKEFGKSERTYHQSVGCSACRSVPQGSHLVRMEAYAWTRLNPKVKPKESPLLEYQVKSKPRLG